MRFRVFFSPTGVFIFICDLFCSGSAALPLCINFVFDKFDVWFNFIGLLSFLYFLHVLFCSICLKFLYSSFLKLHCLNFLFVI